MKKTILLIALSFSHIVYGQTAIMHLENGKIKQGKKDYEGALKEYNKAIESDSSFSEAYYCRASILFTNQKFTEAINDLDKSIIFNPKYSKAILLRGNCNVKIDNKAKACEDFTAAKQLGDSIADKYIQDYFCEYKAEKGENIVLDFPEKENWRITYKDFKNNQNIFFLGRSNETLDNWTEQAGISSIVGIKNTDLVRAMNDFYTQEKEISPKAKLTFIQKDLTAKYPWIMYSIESIYNKECQCYESKFCYLIQGKQSFYSCFRSVKAKSFSAEQKEGLAKFFKTCEIVYE